MLRRRTQQHLGPGAGVGPQPASTAAIGILRALDPFSSHDSSADKDGKNSGLHSEDSVGEEKKEKKGFWGAAREKDRDRERERDKGKERGVDDGQAELTRMIGFLTATASEDWSLVLEVCDRASASEANAKEAVKALRREFKYAEPPAQLSAARLWAIMLRNSSEIFMQQIMSRKFLDTLEEVLTSSRTSPVVRERLMDVLAAVAYASGNKNKDPRADKDGFRGLWRRLKPADKPDEGVPFDIDDAMFNPPMPRATSEYSLDPHVYPGQPYQQQPPVHEHQEVPPGAKRNRSLRSRNRIIPPEEDIRRLFQECTVGQGNASLLSEALAYSRPDDLEKGVVQEFYAKCRASQELIFAQIPWASAGAERSRLANGSPQKVRTALQNNGSYPSLQSREDEAPSELTVEEELLAALLAANEKLLEALGVYDDLERVGVERQAEEISRRDVKMDRRQLQYQDNGGQLELPQPNAGGSSSRSPSPSPTGSPAQSFQHPSFVPSITHPLPRIPGNNTQGTLLNTSATHLSPYSAQNAALVPPPPAPHGPRSPILATLTSRTPSPERFISVPTPLSSSDHHSRTDSSASSKDYHAVHNGLDRLQIASGKVVPDDDDDEATTPIKPSAKALGKRKVVEAVPDRTFDTDEMFYGHRDEPYPADTRVDSDSDELCGGRWPQTTQYVYDAAAERTQQRIRRGRVSTLVDGVH
jgi:hypothetical protein